MPALTYSPTTGHVKVDGAVVGFIEKKGTRFVFIRYKFATVAACKAATLAALLPKIRKELLGDDD